MGAGGGHHRPQGRAGRGPCVYVYVCTCAAKWGLGGARVVSREGSRPGRRAFPVVPGCVRVALGRQGSSESRKIQILRWW